MNKYIFIFLVILSTCYYRIFGEERDYCGPVDYYHPKVLDANNHLLSWHIDENGPFEYILGLSAAWWKNAPEVNGWPIWCTAAEVDREFNQYNGAIPGSACYFSIMANLKYYVYTGDTMYRYLAKRTGDYIINQALTPSSFLKYPDFPYAVGDVGDITPEGTGHPTYNKDINPIYNIQPDKGAMLGVALLELYKVTGNIIYLNISVNIANCLSDNALSGDETTSPWPMRVMADNGNTFDGEFSANVSFACRLFDELLRIGQSGNGKYKQTRDNVWNWLKTYVIAFDDASKWKHFFEDHRGSEDNPTQINALETARYLLEKKNEADADWFNLVGKIINQVRRRWSDSDYDTDGYISIAEQENDVSPYNSHTARFGSILAMYAEAGVDVAFKDTAFHSLCYSLYSVENDGFTCTSFKDYDNAWTTDSHGDFLYHYMDALAAVPEWAGASNHLLKSTGTIKQITYNENKQIFYTTYDNTGTDKLKLIKQPVSVKVNGTSISSFTWDEINKVLVINRSTGTSVVIDLENDVKVTATGKNRRFFFYPNPVSDYLKVNISFGSENPVVSVITISGKTVFTKGLKTGENEICLSNLKKGMYILRITTDKENIFHDFIKI